MENTEQDPKSPPPAKTPNDKNKNTPDSKGNKDEHDAKTSHDDFIKNMEETENLIDPGNEHHHRADEVNKNIGSQ